MGACPEATWLGGADPGGGGRGQGGGGRGQGGFGFGGGGGVAIGYHLPAARARSDHSSGHHGHALAYFGLRDTSTSPKKWWVDLFCFVLHAQGYFCVKFLSKAGREVKMKQKYIQWTEIAVHIYYWYFAERHSKLYIEQFSRKGHYVIHMFMLKHDYNNYVILECVLVFFTALFYL